MKTINKLSKFDKGWLIGFIEGEGCFTWRGGSSGKFKRKYPAVQITQNELSILKRISKLLGGGNIYITQKKKEGIAKTDIYTLSFCKRKDVEYIRDLCRGLLKSNKKKKQFIKWLKYFNSYQSRPKFEGGYEISEKSKKRMSIAGKRNSKSKKRDGRGRFICNQQ